MIKKILFSIISILFFQLVSAQILEPIHWKHELKKTGDNTARITHTATIDQHWHLYSLSLPDDGPIPTTISYEVLQGATLHGKVSTNSKKVEKYDNNFAMTLSWYEGTAVFVQELKTVKGQAVHIEGTINFMTCDDQRCLPPANEEFTLDLSGSKAPAASAKADPSMDNSTPGSSVPSAGGTDIKSANITADPEISNNNGSVTDSTGIVTSQENTLIHDLWTPVISELQHFGKMSDASESSLIWIFLAGLLGGFLALFTPCVWPIIPMTVSFFLKRSKDTAKGKRDAILYGISIIIIYVLLGILITVAFGASALNSMSTNAVFNLIFFGLLVIFAISFFGAFEITLPSSWSTKLDSKAESTAGFLSILLMAFTLVLVSFSCTGPIIGTLLVEVAQTGSIIAPAIGMFGFAVALAIPFTFFAFFPSLLKGLPKSGGWLNKVKVILAFLELALALKFLSVADLAYGWRILDREVFISIWIVLFILLGFYLLGKLKFPHDSESKHTSVSGVMMAVVSFAFAIYMIPGLWGAPLKSISAFAPPLYTQDFNLYHDEVEAKFTDYESGMRFAADHNLPVVVDFTGFGCVNCRKMEASVWTDASVKDKLENDYVLISLFVDDKTALATPYTVEENGKTRKIKTIGDKWSYLQRSKFGANAQPFYVMLDKMGYPLNKSFTFNEDPAEFLNWLERK